jgi:hypothetical protein
MSGWALARVYGNGNAPSHREPDTSTTGPWRPATDGYGPFVCLIPPGSQWALVRYGDAFDEVAAAANPDVRILPNLAYDHVLTVPERGAINRHLDDLGVVGVSIVSGMTVLDAIRAIAESLDMSWDPESQAI